MNHIRVAVTATALVIAFAVAGVFVLTGSQGPTAVRLLPADGRSQPSQPSAGATTPVAISPAHLAVAYTCGASTVRIQASGATSFISTIRAGAHSAYDRLVVEFAAGVPGTITITPQPTAGFINSPRGDVVQLAGTAGLQVVMHDADAHTSFSGPAGVRPNGAALVEVRRVEDFEGYVGLGLGLSRPTCYHAFMLSSPTRLVIDLQVG